MKALGGDMKWLLLILVIAFFIRIPGVPYGLPEHLIGDEEVSVYTALRMIEIKTLLPILHPDEFHILYAPPVLSYIYTVAFVPVLGVMYLAAGMPSAHVFADALILDTSWLWIVGRLINVFISLLSIYLIYRISIVWFKKSTAALFAALLLATSFINATLSATTRHWEAGTFFSLLALFCVLSYVRSPARRLVHLAIAGAVLGVSFGSSYLVYYAPFMGLLILFSHWQESRSLYISTYLRPALYFGGAFTLVALLTILVAPEPFSKQVLNHVSIERHTFLQFIQFYLQTFWNYETPLLIAALIGIGTLLKRRERDLLIVFTLFFATVIPIMFVFLWDLERYVHPLLPILALLGGYGIATLNDSYPRLKLGVVFLAVLVCYSALLFGRYAILTMREDTRLHAKAWILSHIQPENTLIIDSDPLRFYTTPKAAALLSTLNEGYVRAQDRVVQKTNRLERNSYNAFHMFILSPPDQVKVFETARAFPAEKQYLITDSWSTSQFFKDTPRTPIASFNNESAVPVPEGLYIAGEEHSNTGAHVLSLLWNTRYLGPDVDVFELEAPH